MSSNVTLKMSPNVTLKMSPNVTLKMIPNVTLKMSPNVRWKSVEMQPDCRMRVRRKCDSDSSCNPYITTKPPVQNRASHSTVTINKCESSLSFGIQPKTLDLDAVSPAVESRKEFSMERAKTKIQIR